MSNPVPTILTLCAGLVLGAGGAGVAAAPAERLQDFRTRAPVTLQGDGPYYQLTLPLAAQLGSHFLDLRDLRVFNGDGEPVPFSVIRASTHAEAAERRTPLNWFPLYAPDTPDSVPDIVVVRRPDGTVVSVTGGDAKDPGTAPGKTLGTPRLRGYLLDLSQARNTPRRLELDWDTAVTGFQQLSVDASDDLQTWRPWQRSAQLARLEYGGQRLERREIELPGGHADYVRLTWNTPQQAPPLTSAVLTSSASSDPPAPLLWSEATAPTRAGAGEYQWEFPQPLAIERIRIAVPEVNVLTPAEVSGRARTEAIAPWQVLTTTVLYRLQIDGKELQQLEVTLPGVPVKTLKLKTDPRTGGLGANPPTLAWSLTSHQLLFLARGSPPFVVAEGNDQAGAAGLVPATLIPGYGTSAAPPVSAAALDDIALEATAPQSAPEPASGGADWKTLVLWAVLLTGVAAIAAIAMQLLRQTRGMR